MLLKVTVSTENETALQMIPASASGAKTQKLSEGDGIGLYRSMEDISFDVTAAPDYAFSFPGSREPM